MTGPTVLIVDDERTLARSIKTFLTDSGYEAEVAGDAEKALELLESFRPDVVFADVRLPGMGGIELLQHIRDFDSSIPVIIMTAYGSIEGAVEAVKLGAFDYLKKPVDLEELKLLADRARETSLLKQELSYYRGRGARKLPFAGMIGESPAIRAIMDQARQIAALDDTPPVLITGETGTGKGLIARHDPRERAPRVEAVHRGELHRASREPDGGGAVRPRARSLHRREAVEDRALRGGGARLHLSRRDRRHGAPAAGQAAARDRGAHGAPRGRHSRSQDRRAHSRRDESRPRARGAGRHLSPRSLLPSRRHSAPASAAARSRQTTYCCSPRISCAATARSTGRR